MRLQLEEGIESVRCAIDVVSKKQFADCVEKELQERTEKALREAQAAN